MRNQRYKPIKDISVLEFLQRIPNKETAIRYLEQLRWGTGQYCPHCDSKRIAKATKPQPYRCKECRKHFSVRTGTAMESSRISLHNWLMAIYLITVHRKSISSLGLARVLGITQKSAWHLGHRIRTAFE